MKRQIKQNTLTYLLIFISTISSGFKSIKPELPEIFNQIHGNLSLQFATFDGAHLKKSKSIDPEKLPAGNKIEFETAVFNIKTSVQKDETQVGAYQLTIKAKLLKGEIDNFSLGLKIDFNPWSVKNYVLMPGAAYNGNRYKAVRYQRKHLIETVKCSPDMEPVMTTVPRLQIGNEKSFMDFLSGDMSAPSFGVHFQGIKKGFFIVTEQGTKYGDYSYKIEESDNRDKASFLLRMPALREDSVQLGREGFYPSPDRGARLKEGDSIEISCLLYFFDAPEEQSLFDRYVQIRKKIGTRVHPNHIPYSAAWNIQEAKYNEQNWVEKYGYYSVGMRESRSQDWQTAWVGGLNTVYPLLVNGNQTTRERALRTFDFVLDNASPSGLLYGTFYNGEWLGKNGYAFMRYQADGLYFLVKSLMLYQQIYPEKTLPGNWYNGTKKLADALAKIFTENGQFGQHLNYQTGAIVAGGTASGGIAIGALALSSHFFGQPGYLQVAKAAGDYYNSNFIQKGLTNGGPGDIFQAPDSESAFGLLESYVVLYEITQDPKWLKIAKDIANQCASWVVSYDYRFPHHSTFNNLGMLTNGTVIANVQNKHSAPGICSLSGNSLLKLYRYTNDETYLELIADISRAIPQYMSRTDRPIPDVRPNQRWPVMPPGWINERVNMSDWEERGTPGDIKRGEIFGGSTWSEVACMLTYAELPGIYISKDKGQVTVLDNFEAEVINKTSHSMEIKIYNPSDFDAKVKVMSESSDAKKKVLPLNYFSTFEIMDIKAKESKILRYNL
jgi:hypothetical protein